MEAFSVVEGCVESLIEDSEREALAHLVSEVAALLGVDVAERAEELGLVRGKESEDAVETPIHGAHSDLDQLGEAAWQDIVTSLENAHDDAEPTGPPADPAVERLLPTVSSDAQVAADYRRLTQNDLRIAKADRLVRFWVHLQPENGPLLRLELSQGEELMTTITDLRLVLMQRVGVKDAQDLESLRIALEMGELNDHVAGLLQVADVLAWWQESLIFGLQMLDESR